MPAFLRPAALVIFLCAAALSSCSERDTTVGTSVPPASPVLTGLREGDPIAAAQGQMDLLFVVDSRPGMFGKPDLLARTAAKLVARVATPRCVPASARSTCVATIDGGCLTFDPVSGCPAGSQPETTPVIDLHVGLLSSSLGTQGGEALGATFDTCAATVVDRAHLVTRAASGGTIAGLSATGDPFLAWTKPSGGETESVATLGTTVADLVRGIGTSGCDVSAPLESLYEFLIAPVPWDHIALSAPTGPASLASYAGTANDILRQRRSFLRPTSVVVVVVLTDSDDASIDPLAAGGRGWRYDERTWPDAASPGGAPRATSLCASAPDDPTCAPCDLATSQGDATCRAQMFYSAAEDPLGLRFYRLKQRYGVDPLYPLARYTQALNYPLVPNPSDEHQGGAYVGGTACTNPLFAATLFATADAASAAGTDLCHLPFGTRTTNRVYLALVAGAPNPFLYDDVGVAPQRLAAPNWTSLLGTVPGAALPVAQDAHMITSTSPRPGLLPPAPRGDNGTDPISGREFDGPNHDLEYACTYPLRRDGNADGAPGYFCGGPNAFAANDPSPVCDCNAAGLDVPLCAASSPRRQIRGRAYPSLRPLAVAEALGEQALVASSCPLADASGALYPDASPWANYDPIVDALVSRLASGLTSATGFAAAASGPSEAVASPAGVSPSRGCSLSSREDDSRPEPAWLAALSGGALAVIVAIYTQRRRRAPEPTRLS